MDTALMGKTSSGARVGEAATASPPAARELRALWLAAVATAALGTATIWMAMPGINWGLWTLALAAGVIHFARRGGKTLSRELLIPLGLACAIALGTAFTANEAWHAFSVLVTAGLVAIAVLLARGERREIVGPVWMATAPIRAALAGLLEVLRRVGEAAGVLRGERAMPAVRGIVIALPIVGLFGVLLAGADPTLARWLEALERFLERLDWIPRLVFFSFLGTIALGGFGMALRPPPPERSAEAERSPLFRLGVTERTILLASMAGLFALFLALQVSYLFGNAPSVAGSGVTFAEYARRGFGELTVVATLCTLLVLLTDRYAERGASEERVRITQLVLVAEMQLLLVSAFRRVLLYEGAYGFTSARLYAQAYMVVMSICLAMLAWEIWRSIDVRRLVRRAAVAAGGAFVLLTFWNHDAWIARQNVERYASTGKIDVWYLGRVLSPNALPPVVAALDRLRPADAAALRACLHERYQGNAQWQDSERWFEWNLRRSQARRALARAGVDFTVAPPKITDAAGAIRPCSWTAGA